VNFMPRLIAHAFGIAMVIACLDCASGQETTRQSRDTFIESLFGNTPSKRPYVARSQYFGPPPRHIYSETSLDAPRQVYVAAPTGDPIPGEEATNYPLDPRFARQEVDYRTDQQPGTIVIDTPHYFLYLVEAGGKALRYGIGVGRPGFTWSGEHQVSAKKEWPSWVPPKEMLQRQPYLPRFVAGGPNNPLGARAMYLGSTLYRIHGSNEPWTIGHNVSSGCIRLRNADVIDLYDRVTVGTKVVVL
jgi:lipoprotein-anchoring transpeptidase ErfK/SrfK